MSSKLTIIPWIIWTSLFLFLWSGSWPEGAVSGTRTRCRHFCSSSSSHRETSGRSCTTSCRVMHTGGHEGTGEHCKYVLSCFYTSISMHSILLARIFWENAVFDLRLHLAGVFELHMEELRLKQEEIAKKDSDIKVLEAIIRTLSSKDDTLSSKDDDGSSE